MTFLGAAITLIMVMLINIAVIHSPIIAFVGLAVSLMLLAISIAKATGGQA